MRCSSWNSRARDARRKLHGAFTNSSNNPCNRSQNILLDWIIASSETPQSIKLLELRKTFSRIFVELYSSTKYIYIWSSLNKTNPYFTNPSGRYYPRASLSFPCQFDDTHGRRENRVLSQQIPNKPLPLLYAIARTKHAPVHNTTTKRPSIAEVHLLPPPSLWASDIGQHGERIHQGFLIWYVLLATIKTTTLTNLFAHK